MRSLHKLPTHLTPLSPAAWIATFFGFGLLRPASGTWGSLAGLVPGMLIAQNFGASGLIFAATLAYVLGHWASAKWITGTEDTDPSPIVIDEVAGLWLTLTLAPLTPLGIALAFVLFRLFDIAKPWPVRWADRNIGGPTGIMLDDVLAGIWAALVLLAAREFGLI
ncbi:MAG TPA: phosphatidylglycerophosphatase A [Rhodobiaceae bacterium]|nr:phosphatidylglycerophosphatase A [Rhodobiaceae bacterium]|tara:strand:- start:620 stop:1114 length:495 start_codon:yes stop_codon:yes gene_type:complete